MDRVIHSLPWCHTPFFNGEEPHFTMKVGNELDACDIHLSTMYPITQKQMACYNGEMAYERKSCITTERYYSIRPGYYLKIVR